MSNFEAVDEELEGILGQGKSIARVNSSKGGLINTDTGGMGGIGGLTVSKEQRRAQQKAERIHYDAELKKLETSLESETKEHERYHSELTKENCAKISAEFQSRIDRLHISRQVQKTEAYNNAVELADSEVKRIEGNALKETLKLKLIIRIMDNLEKTLTALDDEG